MEIPVSQLSVDQVHKLVTQRRERDIKEGFAELAGLDFVDRMARKYLSNLVEYHGLPQEVADAVTRRVFT